MILRLTRVCKWKRGARERNFQSWLDRRTFPPRNARSTPVRQRAEYSWSIDADFARNFEERRGWLKSESFSSRARGGRQTRDENSGDCCVPVHRTSKNVCKVSFSSVSIANLTDKRSCEHAKLVRQRAGLSFRIVQTIFSHPRFSRNSKWTSDRSPKIRVAKRSKREKGEN